MQELNGENNNLLKDIKEDLHREKYSGMGRIDAVKVAIIP